jgi:two-component system, NtrC family, sensor histidine kinase HydH
VRRLRGFFQPGDFAWLLFVAILMANAPETNYDAFILLPLIGAFQIVEPRLKIFRSQRGQLVSLGLKMMLSYLLVGWTHAMYSYYYQIFLIPVVSAATTFELVGVLTVTAIAGLAYFSFLLPIFDYDKSQMPPDQISIMSLRVAFFAIVAFLVYEQARAKRLQMARTEEAAAQLAESNKSLREAQVSLRRSERLAALGQLTAGLAHELRNPLGTIKASAEMLTKQSLQERPEVRAEMADYIGSEVNRMNSLITSFLNFARPLQIHPAEADLNAVVDQVTQQQAELARDRQVRVVVRRAEIGCKFVFDADLLKVALSNLVQNAIQASAEGQEVEVRIERGASNVKIWVSDQGYGIPPQHLESIFNPFFTTKPQGVGLGLPIVAKIVDEHQGRIEVFSEEGKGTKFELVLPVA